VRSQSRDTPPKPDFLAFNEAHALARPDSVGRMATEYAASEHQRSIIPSQASQILTPEAIDEEESDFVWYSNRDLGETLRQTRSRFKELFGKNLPDEIPHTQINGTICLKRRRNACEAKSRLVDAEPHRASKYLWVENYYKQEISEANLARATLSLVVLEYLRPFSAKALDFLWFLRFDLGLSASSLLGIFRPQYLKETVWQAY